MVGSIPVTGKLNYFIKLSTDFSQKVGLPKEVYHAKVCLVFFRLVDRI